MRSTAIPAPRFFIQLQGRPAEFSAGQKIGWHSFQFATIDLHQPPMALLVNFEQLAATWQLLPRMFFEMDGSFVWTGSHQETPWQLEGMIYDRQGQVQYVEVKGQLPYDQWVQFTAALKHQHQPIVAHLVDHGAFVDLDMFEQELWKANE